MTKEVIVPRRADLGVLEPYNPPQLATELTNLFYYVLCLR